MWTFLQHALSGFGRVLVSAREKKQTVFIHVYKRLTKEQRVLEFLTNRTQPLISTGLQDNESGVCGDLAPHVGHSTYLYPISNLHILYFSRDHFVCGSGSRTIAIRNLSKGRPSGPSKKGSDLHWAPSTFAQRSVCKLAQQLFHRLGTGQGNTPHFGFQKVIQKLCA